MPVPSGAPASALPAGARAAVSLALPVSGGGPVPWSHGAAPSPDRPARPSGRPVPSSGWPSPAPGWPCLRPGDLAALPAPPLGPAEREPAAAQLARCRRPRAGRWSPAAPWSPPPPRPAWAGGPAELARWEPSLAGWAAKQPAIPAVLHVQTAGSPCSHCVLAGAGVPAARPGAWAPELARCQGRRGCAAGRSRTAPAVLTARFPVPVSYPAHGAEDGDRRCPLPRQPPWLRARQRDRFKTEEHRTVCQSTQTGQLMTNKTCRY